MSCHAMPPCHLIQLGEGGREPKFEIDLPEYTQDSFLCHDYTARHCNSLRDISTLCMHVDFAWKYTYTVEALAD